MNTSRLFIALFTVTMLASCVGKKKFNDLEASYDQAQMELEKTKKALDDCDEKAEMTSKDLAEAKNELSNSKDKVKNLQEDLDYLKKTNTNLLDRLADLSIVNKEGAESIKRSLDAINKQSERIENLTSKIQARDSMNMALVMNLKRSLSDVNDEDVNVEVRKGVVYVSLSDKMLFNTASTVIRPNAENVLSKVAKVLKDHDHLDILVEGHTDDVSIRTDCIKDNWDLSVKRATSVVRRLTDKYEVDAARLTAGGRGEFAPKASNESASGRQANRRTEIIIMPKLDEFFDLAAEK
jgi:chemotaxis protein MotB